MAKKKIKDMTDKDWEAWGKAFGKSIEKKGKKFGDKMEKFGDRMECWGEGVEAHFENKWDKRLGFFSFIGPLIGSIIGIIFLSVALLVLSWINSFVGSTFISALSLFFNSNLHWFFLVSLLLGYGKYITKKFRPTKPVLSPLIGAGGFVFALWILANILLAINVSANSTFIASLAGLVLLNITNIFIVLVVFSYILSIFWLFVREIYW